MFNIEKAAEAGTPQANSKSFQASHFIQFSRRVKATIYKLAPWLFFIGGLHG